MSYTFVTMEVSEETYNEIYEKLALANYHHAILENETILNMRGIALIKKERTEKEKQLAEFAKDFAKVAVKQIIKQASK